MPELSRERLGGHLAFRPYSEGLWELLWRPFWRTSDANGSPKTPKGAQEHPKSQQQSSPNVSKIDVKVELDFYTHFKRKYASKVLKNLLKNKPNSRLKLRRNAIQVEKSEVQSHRENTWFSTHFL